MIDESGVPSVNVKTDKLTESFGEKAAAASLNSKMTNKQNSILVFCVMLFCFAIATSMFFTKKPKRNSKDDIGFAAPSFSRDTTGINPKLLTERDLTNIIRRPRVDSSLLGKIKVVSLRSISDLPIGSQMKAVLVSGGTDGIVKAKITSSLLVDGEPVLPEHAVLFGRGKSGEERLFVEFTKIILPTGETYPIRAQAFDLSDQIQGLKGALVGTRSKKMAGALGFGLLGGMADGMQNTSGSFFAQQKPSVRDAALAGASKAALDQSQAYIEEMKKSPNIIEVKSGTEFTVIIDEPKSKRDGFNEEK